MLELIEQAITLRIHFGVCGAETGPPRLRRQEGPLIRPYINPRNNASRKGKYQKKSNSPGADAEVPEYDGES